MPNTMTRRRFGGACAGFTTVVLTAPTALTWADELPHIDAASAQATVLGYVDDAATADKTKFANFIGDSKCANCALYQGGDAWGGCGIFPGQAVSANGWCSVWAKKPN